MKNLILILITLLALTISACSDKAAEMYDTAQFEELQNNKEHATELYEEIIKKYPESKHANKAKERLSALKQKK